MRLVRSQALPWLGVLLVLVLLRLSKGVGFADVFCVDEFVDVTMHFPVRVLLLHTDFCHQRREVDEAGEFLGGF